MSDLVKNLMIESSSFMLIGMLFRAYETFKTKAPRRPQHSLCSGTLMEALCWSMDKESVLSRRCRLRSLQAKSATVPLWLDGDLGGNSNPVGVSWSFATAFDFDGANIPVQMQTFHNHLLC